MAYFRKKICAYPNCPNYAEKDSAYCEQHKKAEPSRDTTSKYRWLYKLTRWEKQRKQWLLRPENSRCYMCGKPSQLPHHSEGFCDYQTFFDDSKWKPMCKSCHSKLHTTITNEELYNKYHKKSDKSL